jgi:MFS family permease
MMVICQISGTGISLYTTEKMGRKILLIFSGLGMAFAMTILGISFSLMDENRKAPYEWMNYLPLIAMIIFFLAFPIGFNSVILVLLGELFSPAIKGVATSVSTFVWWVAEFVTAKLFFTCSHHLGFDGTFYLFATISVLAAIFVQLFIRESRNKSLAEIQELYQEKRGVCTLL